MNLGLAGRGAVRVLGYKQQTPPLPTFSKREFIGGMWARLKEFMGSCRSKFGDRQEAKERWRV